MEERARRPDRSDGAEILVVDDQPIVLDVAQQLLEKAGYSVQAAASGREALRIFTERSDHIDCVLLDLEMPGMNGVATFEGLREIRADIPVIFSSGFDEDHVLSSLGAETIAGFVQKPYRLRTLEAAVELALGVVDSK